jgi:hypothetical protein
MRNVDLVESVATVIELTEGEATTLRALGKRLAGSKSFWTDDRRPDDEHQTQPDRSVIRCSRVQPGAYQVVVSEAVGIVALPDLQLVVRPKIPLAHFVYLLKHATAFPRVLDIPTNAEDDQMLWDLVASWFIAALEAIIRKGLLSDYHDETDRLVAARGTIRAGETARGYYRGDIKIVCDYDDFSPDSRLNRVLRAAALAVAQSPFLDRDLRRRARRSLSRLEDVGAMRHGDLRTELDRRSSYYSSAFVLARHVLTATGRTIQAGRENAWTFLIRTPELIEEALRAILKDGLAHLMSVEKRGRQLAGSTMRLYPDLVLGSTAVGDVKYKILGGEWYRPDLYQLVTFATGFKSPDAALIGFAPHGEAPPRVGVGDVSLVALAWDVAPDTPPASSASKLVSRTEDWLRFVVRRIDA